MKINLQVILKLVIKHNSMSSTQIMITQDHNDGK